MDKIKYRFEEPAVLTANTFDWATSTMPFIRKIEEDNQHRSVWAFLYQLKFKTSQSDRHTYGILDHSVYGKIEVVFYYAIEEIGTWKKLLIFRNGTKSSMSLIRKLNTISEQ